MVSRKEAINLISDSDYSDQGETSNEEIIDELVANVALIDKHYEENISNGVQRAQSKGGSSMRRYISEKRKSVNCFKCGSPDHFASGFKEKKKAHNLENYEVLYMMLLAHMNKENISLPKPFIAKP